MKIKKGDTVKIISGKDRGKSGKVLKALPKENRVLVEGINLYPKRVRPRRQGEKGETVLVPRPLHVSKVMLVCKSCGRATRIGFRREGELKERHCKKCGAII